MNTERTNWSRAEDYARVGRRGGGKCRQVRFPHDLGSLSSDGGVVAMAGCHHLLCTPCAEACLQHRRACPCEQPQAADFAGIRALRNQPAESKLCLSFVADEDAVLSALRAKVVKQRNLHTGRCLAALDVTHTMAQGPGVERCLRWLLTLADVDEGVSWAAYQLVAIVSRLHRPRQQLTAIAKRVLGGGAARPPTALKRHVMDAEVAFGTCMLQLHFLGCFEIQDAAALHSAVGACHQACEAVCGALARAQALE